jgi:hypothetical protein
VENPIMKTQRSVPSRLAASGIAMLMLLSGGFAAGYSGTASAETPQADATFIVYSEQNVAPGKFTGMGTLTFNGERHGFSIEGMTTAGVDGNHPVEGAFYGARSLDEVAGHYKLVKRAREDGVEVMHLQNENGVRVFAHGINKGMALGTAAGGITVSLEK